MPRKRQALSYNSLNPCLLLTRCPAGWSTVASWWATEELAGLGLLDDPLSTLRQEESTIESAALSQSVDEVFVGSCPAYNAAGIRLERAYPLDFLAAYYSMNR